MTRTETRAALAEYRKTEKGRAYLARRHRVTRAARIKAARAVVDAAKSAPCADCGNVYPAYVMDLDHVRGEKLFQLGAVTRIAPTLGVVFAELAKCDVVCSNCHRVRTHTKKQYMPDFRVEFEVGETPFR